MGKGLIYQNMITPQVSTLAVCDIETERCTDALEEFGICYRVVMNRGEMALIPAVASLPSATATRPTSRICSATTKWETDPSTSSTDIPPVPYRSPTGK